ncbi:phosphoribosylanthranilate isomerase [Effusibacillus pohliae]|uniref:phosphoribosylanthranilate isomerase n=1 Tax=Effusibacillus pohliae TaxID=232270 RepID=UPI00035F970F|nr:phosphoribosylanthranilate isomerase [Effusibacillus pohliae]
MTRIKICGLQTREAVRAAAEAGADFIGFVFARSKRQVPPEQVGELTHGLAAPRRIGVFVDESLESLLAAGKAAALDGFQLHGAESPALCRELKEQTGKLVWKAWPVRFDEADAQIRYYRGAVDAVLLDTYHPGAAGGTGRTFPWRGIARFREWLPDVPIFVAGGLTVDNVGELVDEYRPDGVDVSSGVESNGAKDADKIKRFIERVRERDGCYRMKKGVSENTAGSSCLKR